MSEKGPWGSPEVLRLDFQLATLKEIRALLPRKVSDLTYEVIQGPHNAPEITFREFPGEGGYEDIEGTCGVM